MYPLQVHGSDAALADALLPVIYDLSTPQGGGESAAQEAATSGSSASFPATSNRTYCSNDCKLASSCALFAIWQSILHELGSEGFSGDPQTRRQSRSR